MIKMEINIKEHIKERNLKVKNMNLCIAWIIANPDISCCVFGASKPTQLEDNIKAY